MKKHVRNSPFSFNHSVMHFSSSDYQFYLGLSPLHSLGRPSMNVNVIFAEKIRFAKNRFI